MILQEIGSVNLPSIYCQLVNYMTFLCITAFWNTTSHELSEVLQLNEIIWLNIVIYLYSE